MARQSHDLGVQKRTKNLLNNPPKRVKDGSGSGPIGDPRPLPDNYYGPPPEEVVTSEAPRKKKPSQMRREDRRKKERESNG